MRNEHTYITAITKQGLPQGGGQSPTVAGSLLEWLSKQGVYAEGYADDGVILIIGKVMGILCDIAQITLRSIEKWCQKRSLSVIPPNQKWCCLPAYYIGLNYIG